MRRKRRIIRCLALLRCDLLHVWERNRGDTYGVWRMGICFHLIQMSAQCQRVIWDLHSGELTKRLALPWVQISTVLSAWMLTNCCVIYHCAVLIWQVQSFFRGWLCRRRWKQIVDEYIRSDHAESMRKRNRYQKRAVHTEEVGSLNKVTEFGDRSTPKSSSGFCSQETAGLGASVESETVTYWLYKTCTSRSCAPPSKKNKKTKQQKTTKNCNCTNWRCNWLACSLLHQCLHFPQNKPDHHDVKRGILFGPVCDAEAACHVTFWQQMQFGRGEHLRKWDLVSKEWPAREKACISWRDGLGFLGRARRSQTCWHSGRFRV